MPADGKALALFEAFAMCRRGGAVGGLKPLLFCLPAESLEPSRVTSQARWTINPSLPSDNNTEGSLGVARHSGASEASAMTRDWNLTLQIGQPGPTDWFQ